MTAQWWGGTTFDQIFFYQWLMKSKNEAKSNDVLKMPKDDWNKMIFINHCTTVNYRYMNPPCNGRYRRAPGSQLMRRPNFVAAIVQIVTYHFPSLVQWSRYSRIKDHDRNQPFFYTYPRDCTNASHFLCGVKHKPTCIPEICVRGCVTSESSPLPPMIEGGGRTYQLQVPSPSAYANTFMSRPFSCWSSRRIDFAFTDAQSIPLLLMYVDGTETVITLLYGKQVTFRFNRICLSLRFFDHSLRLRHRCSIERNFLERKII